MASKETPTPTPMNDELVTLIQRQTDYDMETIKQKLIAHNQDAEKVIREYHGLPIEPQDNFQGSTNQKIFKSMREFF